MSSHVSPKDHPRHDKKPRSKLDALPSLASVVRGSLTWAGSVWNYDTGAPEKQRLDEELYSETEDRKEVLYLRMRNVSFCHSHTTPASARC